MRIKCEKLYILIKEDGKVYSKEGSYRTGPKVWKQEGSIKRAYTEWAKEAGYKIARITDVLVKPEGEQDDEE